MIVIGRARRRELSGRVIAIGRTRAEVAASGLRPQVQDCHRSGESPPRPRAALVTHTHTHTHTRARCSALHSAHVAFVSASMRDFHREGRGVATGDSRTTGREPHAASPRPATPPLAASRGPASCRTETNSQAANLSEKPLPLHRPTDRPFAIGSLRFPLHPHRTARQTRPGQAREGLRRAGNERLHGQSPTPA